MSRRKSGPGRIVQWFTTAHLDVAETILDVVIETMHDRRLAAQPPKPKRPYIKKSAAKPATTPEVT